MEQVVKATVLDVLDALPLGLGSRDTDKGGGDDEIDFSQIQTVL